MCLTEYMKKIIKQQKGSKNIIEIYVQINQHSLKSETHANMIPLQEHIDGHDELLPLIENKMKANRIKRFKTLTTDEEKKDYLQFISFCQSQNFSLKQISALGKYLKEIVAQKRTEFIGKKCL